jgi:acyl-coenzyme A thioesterase PaaI-like protein
VPQEQVECDLIERPRKLERSCCFACSPSNPRGLQLEFHEDESGKMVAQWVPNEDFEGFHGIAHGGIVSTVLDEAMAKTVAATGADALTAEMRVRFRQQVSTGIPVLVQGWIESRKRRMFRTEASVTGPDGGELAHAWATFLEVK